MTANFCTEGKSLIQRNYRDDIPASEVERFMTLMLDKEEENELVTPCFTSNGINFNWIRHSNLYCEFCWACFPPALPWRLTLLRTSSARPIAVQQQRRCHSHLSLQDCFGAPSSLLAKSLPHVRTRVSRIQSQVFTEYFKELEEESIRDNFVIIYELLDEMIDFGHVQTTESKILQEYITQESHKLEIQQVRAPVAVTNAVSWRSEGIRYRKNEVFLDVVESVNLLVNASGNVVRSEILGAVKMKCYLSGMPELRLGLNDKVMFENTGRSTWR